MQVIRTRMAAIKKTRGYKSKPALVQELKDLQTELQDLEDEET